MTLLPITALNRQKRALFSIKGTFPVLGIGFILSVIHFDDSSLILGAVIAHRCEVLFGKR